MTLISVFYPLKLLCSCSPELSFLTELATVAPPGWIPQLPSFLYTCLLHVVVSVRLITWMEIKTWTFRQPSPKGFTVLHWVVHTKSDINSWQKTEIERDIVIPSIHVHLQTNRCACWIVSFRKLPKLLLLANPLLWCQERDFRSHCYCDVMSL